MKFKRIRNYSFIAFLMVIGLAQEAFSQLPGYDYRKKFTVSSALVSTASSTNLTDFPVLISLTDADLALAAGFITNSNGFDIAFTSSDGTTQLDHDLESFNSSTGELIAWVRFPTLLATTDTEFYIYFGNSSQTTDQTSTGTWNANYEIVMHMDGGATEVDQTLNGNDGTQNGTGGIPTVAGQIGLARDFERNDSDFINVPDDNSLDITGALTISFWINHESTATPDYLRKNDSYEATTRSSLRMQFRKNSGNNLNTNTTGSTGVWYYYTFVQTASGRLMYRNGVQTGSDTNTGNFNNNANDVQISRSGDAVDGIMDEFRLSSIDRSEDWILTEYNNQNSPGTFYTETQEPPVLSNIEGSSLSFFAGGGALNTSSSITLTTPFIDVIESATIQITGNLDSSEDVLAFSNTANITGSYTSGTGTLALTGNATVAEYQAALRAVTYQNTDAVTPSQLTRTISYTVQDPFYGSNTVTRDINIITTITDLSSDIANVVFHLDALDIDGDLSIADQPSTGTEVTSWGDRSDDEGSSTTDYSFTGSSPTVPTFEVYDVTKFSNLAFNGSSDILTRAAETEINSNSFTEKSFAIVFRTGSSVSGFQNIYEQGGATRGYQISIKDGNAYAYVWNVSEWTGGNQHKSIDLGSVTTDNTYIIIASHDATSATSADQVWEASMNGGSIITLTDVDFQRAHADANGIGGVNAATLDPVTNTSNTGFFEGEIYEFVSWNTSLSGGLMQSIYTFLEEKWVNDSPALASIEGTILDFTEGDAATAVTSTITLSDPDNDNLEGATISISSGFESTEDVLAFTNFSNITGSYSSGTGVLTLSGFDTKANYQTALRSVSYQNTNGVNPSTALRQIDFTVSDRDSISNIQSRSINIIAVNSSPSLSGITAGNLSYTEGDGAVSIISSISISDPDDTNIESATIEITSNYENGEDVLGFIDSGGITGSWNSSTGILTLSGSATLSAYETALQSVTFENSSSDPLALTRTISFTVNDGNNSSNTQSRDIDVTASNSPPQFSNLESSVLTYPLEAVNISNTITVLDPDDTNIDSARVLITGNFQSDEDSLLYSTIFGITGNYDETTGILILDGTASFSDYQTALRSIEYKNYATIPTGPERVISFLAYDDDNAESDTVKRTIDVSAVESISGLTVWLRSDVGVDTTAGGEVITWQDQSGNGYDFTGVADAGIRPTISASNTAFGGEPAISFVGNGDHFEDADGHTNYINGLTEFTLFIVYKADGTNSDRGLWIADTPAGRDEIFTIRYDASGANTGGSFTNVVKTGIRGNTAANQLESFSDIQSTDAQITSLHWEDGTTYNLYVDGILNNPSAAGSPPAGAIINASTVIVGKGGKDDPDATDRSWDGLIAEVILYSRSLPDEERESIEDYLAVKYSSAIRKITAATGGENISADDANGSFTSLTGPIIQEGFAGELTSPGTIVLTAPSGYRWNAGITPGVSIAPAYGGSTTLAASFNSFSSDSTSVTFNINTESSGNPGQITFSGLQVRPNTGVVPNTGTITNTGTTGQGGGTNYGTLSMVSGAADSLTFIQQPTITNIDSSITPSVRVQLVDQFGNELETSGTNIDISLSSGSGTLSGTTIVVTNVLGIAEFSDLSVNLTGTKELTASAAGLNSETSNSFEIVNAGTLTGFKIERVPSGNISAKSAGQNFDIVITAIDGTGDTITTFNGTVVLSSSCTIGTGLGTTASFSSGVLSSTTVSITSVGTCDITATNSSGPEFGTSNTFNVTAGAASETTSSITANPTVVLNDGTSTSTITVALKDAFGNVLTSGGDVVTLSITPTALGSLGVVTDNGDGTYSATLTSSTTLGTDNITGTVNAANIVDDENVEYAAFTHIWESQLGSSSDATNFEDSENWTIGSIPGASSTLFIPTNPAVGNEYPVVDVSGASVASVTMEVGAELTISGGINFTITGDLSGGSILGTNADSITIGGDVLDVTTINVGTVILNGVTAQSITDPHSYTNLVIDNASGVSVQENLIISDSLKLENGELLIPTGTNLLVDGISYGSGSLRFQRAITGNIGWRILSSPVSSTFGDFLDETVTQGYSGAFYDISSSPGDTLQPNVITYLESAPGTDNQRFRAPTSSAQSLTAGQGMFVFFFGDIAADSRYNNPLPDTLDVGGQEFGESGEVDFGITYTTTADSGWNLVGNPFGATIDWDDTPNWTKTNVDATIYVWDPAANGGNGEYLTWNGTTGTLGSGLIAPFQGFWVKANATSPALRVSNDNKTTGGSFLRKEFRSPEEYPMFEIEVSSGGLEKVTSVLFTNQGKQGRDNLDGFTLLPLTDNRLDLHTLLNDGTSLAINHLPTLSNNRIIIPLVIRGYREGVPISDDYLLRFINDDNLPEDWIVLLIDKETGEEINLIEQEETHFFHTTKQKVQVGKPAKTPDLVFLESLSTRFSLMITTEEIEANIPRSIFLEQNYPNPFNPSTTIPFGLNEASNVQLEVYDILGRKVQVLVNDLLNPGKYNISFDASSLSSGVYFYRLITDSKVLVKRLTLIK